jgi:2,4-dienoyl-CoA reductase-like NADH-dependent reductase (Old Yellow Enzyme family)
MHDVGDSDLLATFTYLARALGKRRLAFICARESLGFGRLGPQLKAAFGVRFIANEQCTLETGNRLLAVGEADAVAFGKPFIANPDLPERFRHNALLNEPDPSTFYSSGPKGYNDYAALHPG